MQVPDELAGVIPEDCQSVAFGVLVVLAGFAILVGNYIDKIEKERRRYDGSGNEKQKQ